MRTNVERLLRGYLKDQLELGTDVDALGEDGDLSQAIDSLMMMRLINHLEKELRVTLQDEDMKIDNLRTIASISKLFQRKLDSTGRSE